MEQNIAKNNVSYFIAGYKAALAVNGLFTPEQIEKLDYSELEFGTRMRELIRAYDRAEFDKQGLSEMYKEIIG